MLPLGLFPYTNKANVASVEIRTEGEIFPDILVSYTDCSEYINPSNMEVKKLGKYTVANYGFFRYPYRGGKAIECTTK